MEGWCKTGTFVFALDCGLNHGLDCGYTYK